MRTRTVFALAVLCVWPCVAFAEPSYKSTPLSAWCAELKAKTRFERLAAVRAISEIGPEAATAVQPLLEAYRVESHADLREAYVGALEKIGPDAAPAVLDVTSVTIALQNPGLKLLKEPDALIVLRGRFTDEEFGRGSVGKDPGFHFGATPRPRVDTLG